MSPELLERPADRAATPQPADLWASVTDSLARRVASGLATIGPARAVRVRPLGTRNELAAPIEKLSTGSGVTVHVHLTGHEAVLGPFTSAQESSAQESSAQDSSAGASACVRCLTRRWQMIRPRDLRDALELGGEPQAAGEPVIDTAFVADHVAAVAAGAELGHHELSVVYQVDLERLTVRRQHLLADPECPACGVSRTDDSPMSMTSTPKPTHDEFRALDARDMELPMDALTNPVCGVLGPVLVRDLTSVTTAATAGGFTTRSGTYLRQTMWGGHADSYGASARIGLLEGLERYAGIRARAGLRQVVASLADLGDAALDPRACGMYSPAFYQRHPEIDAFSPGQPIRWVPGQSLRDQRPVLVPEVLAHYQTPDQRRRFVQSTSSGCATGSSPVEATYHGLMEAVERDAFLIGWYAGLALPAIEVRSSARATTRRMVDRLAMYGYDVHALDTRIDFRIPVVTAVAIRRDGGLGTLCVGGGASLDPETALAAALCEIATDAVNLRYRTVSDQTRLRAMSRDHTLVTELHDHPLAYGIPEMAVHARRLLSRVGDPRSLADTYPSTRPAPPLADDLYDDLAWCLNELIGRGFDVIVVDQTLPQQRRLGLSTVNVIVPGLVPIDFGWDRQRALHLSRVRTAPYDAGLTTHPLTDGDLHRVPHPFP
jgi:ribosomal protein S12 methylthiotransferase accessory factor